MSKIVLRPSLLLSLVYVSAYSRELARRLATALGGPRPEESLPEMAELWRVAPDNSAPWSDSRSIDALRAVSAVSRLLSEDPAGELHLLGELLAALENQPPSSLAEVWAEDESGEWQRRYWDGGTMPFGQVYSSSGEIKVVGVINRSTSSGTLGGFTPQTLTQAGGWRDILQACALRGFAEASSEAGFDPCGSSSRVESLGAVQAVRFLATLRKSAQKIEDLVELDRVRVVLGPAQVDDYHRGEMVRLAEMMPNLKAERALVLSQMLAAHGFLRAHAEEFAEVYERPPVVLSGE